MSLEQAISENTEVLKRLTEILLTGAQTGSFTPAVAEPIQRELVSPPVAEPIKVNDPVYAPPVAEPIKVNDPVAKALAVDVTPRAALSTNEVRQALISLGSRSAIEDILKKYGADNALALKPEQYEAVMGDVKRAKNALAQ